MGNCISGEKTNPQARDQDRIITRQLRRDRSSASRDIKMLLLGSGGVGKSTIFKQMDLIHKNGFSDSKREAFSEIIRFFILTSMRQLLHAAESLGQTVSEELLDDVRLVKEHPSRDIAPVAASIKRLWSDKAVQYAWANRARYHVEDSAKGYIERLDEVAAPSYSPSDKDILLARLASTGITESVYDINGARVKMYDVGGQRNERRKWIHCFESVTCVIFVAALSDYDKICVEDDRTNRMKESLTLFEEVANSRWFAETSVILFLNKTDLLKEQLENNIDLSVTFPEYTGGCNYDNAVRFIENTYRSKFRARIGHHNHKEVYVHHTCATDTNVVRGVMTSVMDTLLHQSVEMSGLI